jgi:hypothetical protein
MRLLGCVAKIWLGARDTDAYSNIGNQNWNGTFGPTTPPDYHALPNTLDGTQQRDLNVKATLLRHGNFDYVNNAVIWDPAIPDHTMPNSLYLSGPPAWWGNLPWPPIGANLTPMVGLIPAQQRFANSSPTPTPTPTPQPTPTPTARRHQRPNRRQRLRLQLQRRRPRLPRQRLRQRHYELRRQPQLLLQLQGIRLSRIGFTGQRRITGT